MLLQFIHGRNARGFFLGDPERYAKNRSIPVPLLSAQAKLYFLVIGLAMGLQGCLGLSTVELTRQFDTPIGHDKDHLITELGLPTRDCTPLKSGEACEWQQIGPPHYLRGPLDGTFPGDTLTYFLDSRRIVCQWRFLGAGSGTQHSASRC